MAWVKTGITVDDETWQAVKEYSVKNKIKLQVYVNNALRLSLADPKPEQLPEFGEEYEVSEDRKLLLERFLAFWEQEMDPFALAMKRGLADALRMPELHAEIDEQAKNNR